MVSASLAQRSFYRQFISGDFSADIRKFYRVPAVQEEKYDDEDDQEEEYDDEDDQEEEFDDEDVAVEMFRLISEELPAGRQWTCHRGLIELAGLETEETTANIVRQTGHRGVLDKLSQPPPTMLQGHRFMLSDISRLLSRL